MLNISNELKAIINTDTIPLVTQNVPKELVIYFSELDFTIETDRIVDDSFSLEESLCSDTDLSFGACESSIIRFTLADVEEELKGKEFTIEQHIAGEIIPLGTYTVYSCKKQDNLRYKDIIAYDRLRYTDTDVADWYNSLTFPLSLAEFRGSLLEYLNIEEEPRELPNDDMLVEKTIEPAKLKARDALQACEQINGCFGHMNRYGKFTHIILEPGYGLYPSVFLLPANDLYPVSDTDTSFIQDGAININLSTAMRSDLKFEDYKVKEIDKLQIRQEEGDIGAVVGDGANAYVIEGNFLVYGKSAEELENIALNAFGNMRRRPYVPYQSNNIGLSYIEVGDTAAFDTQSSMMGYILKRTLTGIQALRDAYSAEGSEERKQNFDVNTEIVQLQGKAAVLKRTAEELSNTITDTRENLQSQITQQAGEIALKVSKDGVIAAINLTPEEARITASRITLEGIVTANSNFKILSDGSMEAVNGRFSGIIAGGSININNNFLVDSAGNMIAVGANIQNGSFTGTLTSPVINGGILESTDGTNNTRIENGTIVTSYIDVKQSESTTYVTINPDGIILGGGSDLNVSSGGRINCSNINGGVPITSANISSSHTHSSLYNGSYQVFLGTGGGFASMNDGNLGSGTYRWGTVYAASGTINTSDRNCKEQIQDLSEAEKRVAQRIKGLFKIFKFRDSVIKKGDGARIHTGVIAQDVQAAFKNEGLDPYQYGLFCSDTWYEVDGKPCDEEGNDYTAADEGVIEITRLGLRYEELLCFVIGAM